MGANICLHKCWTNWLLLGWNGACSVSEYNGQFQGRSAKFKVTSTCGHVMSMDFPAQFNNWDRVDPNELFSCATMKKEANPKMKMAEVRRNFMRLNRLEGSGRGSEEVHVSW